MMDAKEHRNDSNGKSHLFKVYHDRDIQPLTQKNLTESTTLIIADIDQKLTGAGQTQGAKPQFEIPLYVIGDTGTIRPLNILARNVVAHNSPGLLKHAVAEAFQRRANKTGLYKDTDCVVRWKPSAVPFHIEFEISTSGNTCQHLASVRNITASDTVSALPYPVTNSLTHK